MSPSPSLPVAVAVVTGGSSGIGLALTNHLVAKKWHVFILDLQPPVLPVLPEATTFVQTNVAQWDELAAAFATAFARFDRLDFVALNAGIDDRDDIFGSVSRDRAKPPRKPNMLPFEVNLFAPYYGLKLAAHYMALSPDSSSGGGGKIVITGSAASLYAHPLFPQYTASKFGVLGLARATAGAAAPVNIAINCLCPCLVKTGLAPPGLLDRMPASAITPMRTILQAFDELALFDQLPAQGRAAWVRSGPRGETVEANGAMLRYREAPRPDTDASELNDPAVAEAWNVYVERNKRFAAMGAGED